LLANRTRSLCPVSAEESTSRVSRTLSVCKTQ
jgi:hypothetical protein